MNNTVCNPAKLRDYAHLVAFKARINEPDEVMLLGFERALIEALFAYGAITGEEHEALAIEKRAAIFEETRRAGVPDTPVDWKRRREGAL